MSNSNPIFILVPGILHTPAHFSLLETALSAKNQQSISISLPNIGPGAATAAENDDAKAVRAIVEQQALGENRDVVLVCHSFGGMAGCQAVNGLEKKVLEKRGIIRIVFLNAFIVTEGETGLDALIRTKQDPPPWIEVDPSNPKIHIPNHLAPEYLFNDLDPATAAEWATKLQPISANHQSQRVSNTCWSSPVPKTYVFGDQDKALWPATQRGMLEQVRDETWTTREFGSGHSPFLSRPEELAELLIEAGRGETV